METIESITPTTFIEALYGPAYEGWLTVFTMPGNQTSWYESASIAAIEPALTQISSDHNIYFGLGLRKNQNPTGRGREEDIGSIPGLWIDLDIADPVHKSGGLPTTIEDAYSLLAESIPLLPSIIIHSGHGLQAYWLFREALDCSTPESNAEAKALCQRFQQNFRNAGAAHGWHVDTTHDLARVFRLPGTMNCKREPFVPVVITTWEPTRRYNPGEFDEWIPGVAENVVQESMQPIPAGDEQRPLAVELLEISLRMKTLILNGRDLTGASRYKSRSEAVFAAVAALVKAGYTDAEISTVLSNPLHALSDRVTENGVTQLLKDIERSRAMPFAEKSARPEKPAPEYAVPMMYEAVDPPATNGTGYHYSQPKAPTVRPTWHKDLDVSMKGKPHETSMNVMLFLMNDPKWKDAFSFNIIRQQCEFHREPLTKGIVVSISEWLGTQGMSSSNLSLVERCARWLCEKSPYDPLQEYVASLPAWDGTLRLEQWLPMITGAEDTEYSRGISKIIPLSMIARALNPGCLYRYVVIFQGPENQGKSTLVRAIAGEEWYTELSMALESKEAHMMLQGAWVGELTELDSMNRTEESRLKAFITMVADSYVPKYANERINVPRRTIFIGTTNQATFLRGETGDTRFLPITLVYDKIDIVPFLGFREQLLAEALVYFLANTGTWWDVGSAFDAEAKEARETSRVVSDHEEGIQQWIAMDRQGAPFTTEELYRLYFQAPDPNHWPKFMEKVEVRKVLKTLGYENKARKVSGRTVKYWMKK